MAAYRVFLSHGSPDTHLVTEHLVPAVRNAGADVFLDEQHIAFGDDFRETIIAELRRCNEVVVLLTASSIRRPWVCAEIGGSLMQGKRIVPVTYGITEAKLAGAGVLSLVGSSNMLKLGPQELGRFEQQLRQRILEASRA